MLEDLWKEVKGIELLYLKYNWNRIVACRANIITNSINSGLASIQTFSYLMIGHSQIMDSFCF